MSVPGRIAMCANPHGLHEHVPLKPDEPMPTTCFADCDCTPVQFVRADATQGVVDALPTRFKNLIGDGVVQVSTQSA